MNFGDLAPSVVATLQNSDGSIFNLTGCNVIFQLSQQGTVLFSNSAIVIDASNGRVQYNWNLGDTNQSGVCQGLFIVTLPGGATQSFPTIGNFFIIFPVQPIPSPSGLTAFTSLADVIGHLNIMGPDSTGIYTIYGLPVVQGTLQAQVDHANIYINSIIANLPSNDPRYPFAQLAALDLACLGVMTAASGGMLMGAADVRLGDLANTKANISLFAYKKATEDFKEDFNRAMANLSTVAVGTSAHMGHQVPRRIGYYGYGF